VFGSSAEAAQYTWGELHEAILLFSSAKDFHFFCRTLKSMSLYFLHNVITYLPHIEALTTIHVNCRNHWYLLVFQISSTMIYVVDSLNHDNDRLEAIRVANL
jgi:hypothetical protein